MPETYVLRVLTMICIPLYHIHSNNIVHGNLKPDDLLSKFLGNQEIFMIIDFGISYYPNSGSVTTARETMSPFYASIE
jgi:serine/threonine protein kinase